MSDGNFGESSNDLPEQPAPKAAMQEPTQQPSSDKLTVLRKELDSEIEKNVALSKKAMYLQADLLNSQRQFERRISEAREEASAKYIGEIILLKEDLERAQKIASESPTPETLKEGLKMLLAKIDLLFEAEEVKKIEISKNSRADPQFHEVVSYTKTARIEEGTVTSVIRNGYTLRGKVIKPALVEVARADGEEVGQQEHQEGEMKIADASQEGKIGA
jgi:molecular chaperone GrpE